MYSLKHLVSNDKIVIEMQVRARERDFLTLR